VPEVVRKRFEARGALSTGGLTRFGREIFFFLHPLLEATLENSPLTTNFEGGYLAMLNHAMQRSFKNL
jgi:hypothetical protein